MCQRDHASSTSEPHRIVSWSVSTIISLALLKSAYAYRQMVLLCVDVLYFPFQLMFSFIPLWSELASGEMMSQHVICEGADVGTKSMRVVLLYILTWL